MYETSRKPLSLAHLERLYETLGNPGDDNDRSLSHQRNTALALKQLASDFLYFDQAERATHCLRRAVSLHPANAALHKALVFHLFRRNRLDEAEEALNHWIAHSPADEEVSAKDHLRAKILLEKGAVAEAISILESLRERDGDHPQVGIRYLLAAALDQAGNYGKAFDLLRGLETILKTHCPDRIRKVAAQDLKTIQQTENPPQPFAAPPISTESDNPCRLAFIVGFPRSGTTLLDQILHGHPAVSVLEETPFLAQALGCEDLMDYPQERLEDLSDSERVAIRKRYWKAARSHLSELPEGLLVDKLPLNILHLRLLLHFFPDATVIVLKRHPLDVILSNFFQHYTLNRSMYHMIGLQSSVNYYKAVMEHYLRSRSVFRDSLFEVSYENLVSHFQPTCEGLLKRLGLPWHDALSSPAETAGKRWIRTPSFRQVSQPIHTASIGKWKRYATFFEPYLPTLQPLIQSLGYSATLDREDGDSDFKTDSER